MKKIYAFIGLALALNAMASVNPFRASAIALDILTRDVSQLSYEVDGNTLPLAPKFEELRSRVTSGAATQTNSCKVMSENWSCTYSVRSVSDRSDALNVRYEMTVGANGYPETFVSHTVIVAKPTVKP